jgi:hypothetical protein
MQQEHATTLQAIKERIWALCKQSLVNVQVAADKAKVQLPITTIAQGEAVMKVLKPVKRKTKAQVPAEVKARYYAVHLNWFAQEFPAAHKDGHYFQPDFPDTSTANGLTAFVTNFLNWSGHRATRITTEGRSIEKDGRSIRIPTQTRKGTADISATIHGRACMIEIKVGRDRPSPAQLKEQAKERKAGGVYEFITDGEMFLQWYDKFVASISTPLRIFD